MKKGIIVLFLIALAFARPPLASAESSKGTEPLKRSLSLLNQAINEAETSLGPHQPGSGWTKQHMHRVLEILNGADGSKESLVKNLSEARQAAGGPAREALDHTLVFLQEAAAHAERSIAAKGIDQTHAEARLAAGMLVAAHGIDRAGGPVTGALSFAVGQASGGD